MGHHARTRLKLSAETPGTAHVIRSLSRSLHGRRSCSTDSASCWRAPSAQPQLGLQRQQGGRPVGFCGPPRPPSRAPGAQTGQGCPRASARPPAPACPTDGCLMPRVCRVGLGLRLGHSQPASNSPNPLRANVVNAGHVPHWYGALIRTHSRPEHAQQTDAVQCRSGAPETESCIVCSWEQGSAALPCRGHGTERTHIPACLALLVCTMPSCSRTLIDHESEPSESV